MSGSLSAILTRRGGECLSMCLRLLSFSFNGDEFLLHGSKLDRQDAVLAFVTMFPRLDLHRKIYPPMKSTERYFQIMEDTTILGDPWRCDSIAGDYHVPTSQKDNDVIQFYTG